MSDWHLIVVGDTKTPHSSYKSLSNTTSLSPDDQENLNKELSDSIGWKSIRRRNMGFIKAYEMGADIMATVDDDNIPNDDWGKEIFVGSEITANRFSTNLNVFDPIHTTEHSNLWHRGFPLQLVSKEIQKIGKEKINCLVQADFWNGDPDIDAVCRITSNA